MSKTISGVVIYHTHSLHMGINNYDPTNLNPLLFRSLDILADK
jgi:hypothetical protein